MNFLTIARRVSDIVGFQGTVSSTSATGYQATLIQAVKDTYEDIQRYRSDWDFRKRHKTLSINSTTESYTLATLWGLGNTVDLDTWQYINYNYSRLPQYTYDSYIIKDLSTYNSQEPVGYAIEPYTQSLLTFPVDQTYTLDGHYIRTIHELSGNSDIPIIPERHHMLIVYGAVMKLSTFVGNDTLFDTYNVSYSQEMGQLLREENPAKSVRKRPIA